jgi:hypothetical protein
MPQPNTISVQKVKIVTLPLELSGELCATPFYQCCFCQKRFHLKKEVLGMYENMSGGGIYCSFCLRHGFNTAESCKNILKLTFRSILGYYYAEKYKNPHNRKIWISELRDYLGLHVQAGLDNPAFNYDPETYQWFLDFSKIGKGKKISLQEVQKTILNILFCFNLSGNIPHFRHDKFFGKFKSAINKFGLERKRPHGRQILAPTLADCGVHEHKKLDLAETRHFLPEDLVS